jgi:hypothetical protein
LTGNELNRERIKLTIMTSNLSILTFLTVGEYPYKIFFIYQKPIEDKCEDEQKYWYEKRGKNGEAKWIWEERLIKQWSFDAKDNIVSEWIERLKTNKFCEERFALCRIRFELAYKTFKEQKTDFDFPAIPDLLNERPSVFITDEKIDALSILVDEPDNIDFIEGYKYNKNITPVLPDKFFEEGFLKRHIQSKTIIYQIPRIIRFKFKGDRDEVDDEKNTKLLFGKCFESKLFRNTYEVEITQLDMTPNGKSLIDENSGGWEVNLITPTNKGFILLKNLTNSTYDYATRFSLLKEFKINVNTSETLVDIFRNEIFIPQSPGSFPIIPPYSWEEEYFMDKFESKQKLSNTLELMLCSLGKNIVLNDPYLFGITTLEDNIPQYNESQEILLNALSIAIVKAGIETITLIGRWDDGRTTFNKGKNIDSKESLYIIYEIAIKALKKQLEKLPSFKLKTLRIIFPSEKFHDRFWAELSDSGNVINIYHISSSVSAYSENGELIILPLEGNLQNKIRSKLETRLKSVNSYEIPIE